MEIIGLIIAGLIIGQAESWSRSPDSEKLPLERVILYIDDLDRCPPDVVIKVLEAVHLLVAFPAFVVVVGVDPRWLHQAIRQHYATVLPDAEITITIVGLPIGKPAPAIFAIR